MKLLRLYVLNLFQISKELNIYLFIYLFIYSFISYLFEEYVLCYKSEDRWFDPSWCHWNFSLTQNPSDRTMALGSTQPLT